MLFSIFYEMCLIVLALISLPFYLYQLIIKKKYQTNSWQRFGYQFPSIKKNGQRLVWVHATSVGETKAIHAFIKRIKQESCPPLILFTNTTETGYQEAAKTIQADYYAYLPFDFGWIIKRIVNKVGPDLVILCETDYWINFLKTAKSCGANTVVINGKMSERSMHRFLKWPYFGKKLFSNLDLFCLQNQIYFERFLKLGIAQEKLKVTGNIKFDSDYLHQTKDQLVALRHKLHIDENELTIVLGSSHHAEESLAIDMFRQLSQTHLNLKLLIVPRHPERFNEVAQLIAVSNIPFSRWSENKLSEASKIILIDVMGFLQQCYQIATVAIVGGSFVKHVGGHNILEPSWYGIPVVFGPYMHNQPDMEYLVLESEAGIQVPAEKLILQLSTLLNQPDRCKLLGLNGLNLTANIHGATAKTLLLLKDKSYL